MIDNFDKIRELLSFRSDDDFYFIQVLQRKKDHAPKKVNGSNNNSRLIKPYYVGSLEYYDFIKPEIIELCKLFNARAGINLNRRSYEQMSLQLLRKVADQIMNKSFKHSYKAYPSVVGAYNHETDKRWIIDVDVKDSGLVRKLWELIDMIRPFGEKKEITTLPSKSGYHMISRPFDLKQFNETLEEWAFLKKEIPGIHKNNPTNLYIP